MDEYRALLRSLRVAAGCSLGGLAARVYCSKAKLGHVETGERPPTLDLIVAIDEALGTTPLLTLLLEIDGEDNNMRRRALMKSATAAVAVGGIAGAQALADVVRHGLLDAADANEDWDAAVDLYSRRLVTDPSIEYGHSLQAQMLIARHRIIEHGRTPDLLRAVAHLGQLYGLYIGNRGDVATARNWYRTSIELSDRSKDTATRVYTRGRAASRGIYEGTTVRETVDSVEEALSLSKSATVGALEAYSALVHVHGLTGNLRDGRTALDGMRRVVDQLPDAETRKPAGPVERTVSFRNYLECRIGGRQDADRAHEEAQTILRPLPVWLADARIYYVRALVTSGDIADGVEYGLAAVKALPSDVRVVSLGVSDLISAVPAGYTSDDLDELRTYAAEGLGPWEMLA
ncbi:MAG: helix-turn-helix domain-containing protein [Micromonosporaceae bacterium]|nr:helix-turn-helix domain-containing protein [Micromonosporaceae bacterium]